MKRAVCVFGGWSAFDALVVEPTWLDRPILDFSHLGWGKTLVHLTDLHYRGNRSWLESIVASVNAQRPDFVCVTGDLMDRRNKLHLPEALEILSGIQAPLFGVPGNHDPRDAASQSLCRKVFAASGGAWLIRGRREFDGLVIHGTYGVQGLPVNESKPTLLLCHFPAVGDDVRARPYDLILCGHSHGGQCRIPGLPPLHLPDHVGRYVAGTYDAPAGLLYVSRGLGSTLLPLRFCCRPELPVIRT